MIRLHKRQLVHICTEVTIISPGVDVDANAGVLVYVD
jgi:hypothetical protein